LLKDFYGHNTLTIKESEALKDFFGKTSLLMPDFAYFCLQKKKGKDL